jgi:hypothetical protein
MMVRPGASGGGGERSPAADCWLLRLLPPPPSLLPGPAAAAAAAAGRTPHPITPGPGRRGRPAGRSEAQGHHHPSPPPLTRWVKALRCTQAACLRHTSSAPPRRRARPAYICR